MLADIGFIFLNLGFHDYSILLGVHALVQNVRIARELSLLGFFSWLFLEERILFARVVIVFSLDNAL
jgi:hypothetical protein